MPPAFTPARPWAPLSDREWDALSPFFHRSTAGRPVRDARARLDAIFALVTTRNPWRLATQTNLAPGSVERQFRRWARAGVWERLMDIAAAPGAPFIWKSLRHWLYRAFARAHRLVGLAALLRAKKLGLWSALPGPPWMLPNPDLSETLQKVAFCVLESTDRRRWRWLRLVRLAFKATAGRRIPRALVWGQ